MLNMVEARARARFQVTPKRLTKIFKRDPGAAEQREAAACLLSLHHAIMENESQTPRAILVFFLPLLLLFVLFFLLLAEDRKSRQFSSLFIFPFRFFLSSRRWSESILRRFKYLAYELTPRGRENFSGPSNGCLDFSFCSDVSGIEGYILRDSIFQTNVRCISIVIVNYNDIRVSFFYFFISI